MKSPVVITINTCNKKGTISFTHLTNKEKYWIAEALMDDFVVDDAYYSSRDAVICVQNWHVGINESDLLKALHNLLHELEHMVSIGSPD